MDWRTHLVRASRPWHCTPINIIPQPSFSQPCFHPHLQSLSITPICSLLAQLHSSNSSAYKQRGIAPLPLQAFAAQLFNWHSLAYTKGDILCISNPKSRVPLDNDTKAHGPLHTSRISDDPMRPCHRCSNFKFLSTYAAGKYTQVCKKVRFTNPFTRIYLLLNRA